MHAVGTDADLVPGPVVWSRGHREPVRLRCTRFAAGDPGGKGSATRTAGRESESDAIRFLNDLDRASPVWATEMSVKSIEHSDRELSS